MNRQIVWLLLCLGLWAGAACAQGDHVCRVEKIVIATSVELRDPLGEAKEFDAAIGRVCCWMRIACADIPQEVNHVWYREGERLAEVPLTVKFPSMRTWSSKNIWPGNWKVCVEDKEGTVLAEVGFVIR